MGGISLLLGSEVWLPQLCGLVVALVGVASSYLFLRRQIHAQVVSASRVAWIGNLRDAIAEFQSVVGTIAIAQIARDFDAARFHETLSRASLLLSRTHLLINPTERLHQDLVDSMTALWTATLKKGPGVEVNLQEEQKVVTTLAQKVLKAEWERTKSGS